ncbi:MAG: cation:proton antiporter [Planctomycetes bacterium]|nr:cation:proton antiporter [Planctomycetota bacterium]
MGGFLAVGVLVGPHGLGVVANQALVDRLAEIGVVVLLFSVGLELSFAQVVRLRRYVLLGGGLQVGLTLAAGAVAGLLGGLSLAQSLFLGFLVTHSSTTSILRLLSDRGEIDSPAGRPSIAISLAQDLVVVPMILLVPLLAGAGEEGLLPRIGLSFLGLAALVTGAWFVIPRVLSLVVRTRSREILVLTVITLCFGTALATGAMGLSMALGAFLAGLVLGESPYRHLVQGEVEPLRDALTSMFFVSIGMLFDPAVVAERPLQALGLLAALLAAKALIVFPITRFLGLPGWVQLRTALWLAQVGEFAFVLMQVPSGGTLLPADVKSLFVVVAVVSIALTPVLFLIGDALTHRRPDTRPIGPGPADRGVGDEVRDHAILVGLGTTGQAVRRALERVGVPHVGIELNAATVHLIQTAGGRAFVGDATRPVVLRSAGIERARLLVIATNDAEATRRTVALARRLNPHVRLIVRATYLGEVAPLLREGVRDVVPLELETTVEILVRALRHFLVPDDEIGRQVREVREGAFAIEKAARPTGPDPARFADYIPELSVESFRVEAGSVLAGKSVQEVALRTLTGCTLVAVRRGTEVLTHIGPETRMEPGDVAVLLGPAQRMGDAALRFRAP